ncbi:MFS transporter [Paralimibaculum aggregatum]|uniref:MFS transporter n=1 Tax=Paralimibaculum aggregatum TaxID=3036245 RepID=A0ABQ6LJR6_9RHOB|nr:MFS transporter [Limibaculum sp. NKW23]GMG81907.1 MFS transporter [Limibaculum sp. NKW23]
MTKRRAVGLLILAEILAMGLWFSSAAVLPEMGAEAGLPASRLAWLATAVQLGFAGGALGFAVLGLADRYDPRAVFFLSAMVAAAANLALLWAPLGGWTAILLRAVTGAALAGVYPVGMKIAVGWGQRDRALLVSLLVCALTLGSASPHLIALGSAEAGGTDWRAVIAACSGFAALGGVLALLIGLGPHHARAARLDPGAIRLAWTEPRIRYAFLGYLGHMWELYALWAWVGLIAQLSFAEAGIVEAWPARLTAFAAIALGGLACIPAGWLADRAGRARTALGCLLLSCAAGLATAAAFGGSPWLAALLLIAWGIAVIPDSALYSTLVADAAPPERAGSLMTLQTALGFLLTAATVQTLPLVAGALGWPGALALLAIGPAAGAWAMRRLIRLRQPST